MLYHDVAEAEVGDVPATTKWNYPKINEMMVKAEKAYELSIGVGDIVHQVTDEDKQMCDIADKLELVLHCYRLMQQGNSMAEEVFLRGVDYLNKKYKKELIFQPASEIIKTLCDDI
jgi:5'-deoxynucleotidase YfbR-like HD superfamily hydrolase